MHTHPLTDLTKKSLPSPFCMTPAATAAFEKLKELFTHAPVLRFYDPTLPCHVFTDASDFAISGILQQTDESDFLHPVAFFSRKLTPAEINYQVYDKELLAIIETFRDMRAWLMGSPVPVSVFSDHKNLEWFMTTQNLNRRQARWAMFLSDFDFKLDWKPGATNIADAPSRRPDFIPKEGDEHLIIQQKMLITPYHTEHIQGMFLTPHLLLLLATPTPFISVSALTTLAIDNSELLERFKSAFQEDILWRTALVRGSEDFRVESDLVFHKGRLYVPPSLRLDILASRHDSVLAGHPGRTRTLQFIARDYSWPGMVTFVRRYVAACDTCARIKAPRHKPYGLLQPLDIPMRPWASISMDFIVKLPSSHGFDSIFVVCDRLTRAAHFIPCMESMSAEELAWLFLDRIFRLHGTPLS